MEQTTDNTSANGKESIAAYRERIVAAICQTKDKDGNARYNEEEARELSEELSDEDRWSTADSPERPGRTHRKRKKKI